MADPDCWYIEEPIMGNEMLEKYKSLCERVGQNHVHDVFKLSRELFLEQVGKNLLNRNWDLTADDLAAISKSSLAIAICHSLEEKALLDAAK